MKSGSLFTILISLLAAALVAYFGNNWFTNRLAEAQRPAVELTPVVAAAGDLGAGTKLGDEALAIVQVPINAAPPGSFPAKDKLLGALLRQPVYKGEILIDRRVLNDPAGSPLAALLTPGNRAITVRVDDVSGVAGFLLPGSLVDVLAIQGGEVRTAFERLKILAVGQQLEVRDQNAVPVRAVTLETTPRQSEQLAQVASVGSIQLTLRNPKDTEAQLAETPPLPPEMPESIGLLSELPPPPPEPKAVNVQVVRVTSVTTATFKE